VQAMRVQLVLDGVLQVNLPSLKGGASSRLGRVSGLAKGSSCPQNVDRTDSVGMPGEPALLAGENGL